MSKHLDISTQELDKEHLVRFLTAIGDPQRLELILLLAYEGPLNAGVVAEKSPLSRTAVSHHLKILKDAGVVTSEKRGKEVIYSFDDSNVVGELQALIDTICGCF